DPDTPLNTLTYSLTGAPSGAAINPTTGIFTWTPTETQGPGTYFVKVKATDNGSPALSDSHTIKIVVREVNRAPVLVNDSVTTAEDVPVVIDVLANDTDEDGHELRITSLGSSARGLVVITDDGRVRYQPSLDFHGRTTFTYSVTDGYATVVGTVTVDVEPVNDRPIAADDHYRLTRYVPAELNVLFNDFDADDDALSLTLKSEPVVGSVTIEGDHFVYRPKNGWTGSVKFTYVARDPRGASSEATVEVVVGDEVLIGARERAIELGVDGVPFTPPQPSPPKDTGPIDLNGISLLADSFFQTVGSLRIPLGFLGLTVAMVVGLGTATEVPALVFGSRRRHWAVVRLSRSQRLPAYSEPGGRKVVYNYDPTADGIISIGKTKVVGNTEWLPVDTPNGSAWIYRKYLTEQVDLQGFTEDRRPIKLVHELARRLAQGKPLGDLISKEGLIVALTGPPSRLAPDQLSSLMGTDRLRHLPDIGKSPRTPAEFTVAVAEPFLEAYRATPEISAYRAHSSSALIPTECWNFPYMSLGNADGVQPWLVFFEYRHGRAWIAGIGIDE
ncbi:MAG: Ig-like domain-containing protein, partial [Acidimicrobiia bacterium]